MEVSLNHFNNKVLVSNFLSVVPLGIPKEIWKQVFLWIQKEENLKNIRNFFLTCKTFKEIGVQSFNFKIKDNQLILSACRLNSLEAVKALLNNQLDPSTQNNEALQIASDTGNAEIVQLLLADSRVNPAACANAALCNACLKGHTKVVEILLKDGRVDPSKDDSRALRLAGNYNRIETVEILLKDGRSNPLARNKEIWRVANEKGYNKILELLHNS